MTTVIILGATGLVGQQLLQQALANPTVSHVVAPTRRALSANAHAKLENPIVIYDHLPVDATWWKTDVVLCALGTTIKQAGSQAAFYQVDHDYVMAAAKLAHAAGTPCFVLNSSLGAKPDAGSFYLRVKGELEQDLKGLGFSSLTIVRPSLLDGGARPDSRPGEAIAIVISKALGVLIPKQWRPVTTAKVARAMLTAGLNKPAGTHVLESDALQD